MNNTSSQSAGNPTRDTDVAWLTGIFEGEGCITLTMAPKKNGDFAQVIASIANTDFAIIEMCGEILKAAGVGRHIGRQAAGKHRIKVLKQLRVTGFKRVAAFGELLMPHLVGVKRLQMQNALAFTYSRLLTPGRSGGKERTTKPYNARELWNIEIAKLLKGSPNDHTPELVDEINKIWSGLRRQYAEVAEMTTRPENGV